MNITVTSLGLVDADGRNRRAKSAQLERRYLRVRADGETAVVVNSSRYQRLHHLSP